MPSQRDDVDLRMVMVLWVRERQVIALYDTRNRLHDVYGANAIPRVLFRGERPSRQSSLP